ncbi:chromosome segregation ATPase [Chthonomonas calidirosea]|uniref:Chromosome segregation ATPase n=1 Tax=Chthonomonas calidirosea (strain DSM 23976 / ICMP 18418 / T49) TaxID=1303518 RepID=S0EWB0_CHTCT|nr:ParA family protein [Chthonomonas calidirosea]CCW35709.1 chromosome segregation ATPase [Chthonomonas calidirosea T49]CEK18463.1 chromosome segregation ATPase [Chthonomonas calidirosea]CEK18465.1 chromosome segregation ATPase [Chthonomonas calidirosea]CEK19472.1 chromosome segregation ATPase [Chthonomonas calidirosea]
MTTVYAIVNQKGGVGKTTTAINIAAYTALAGARTLLIDLDPQGNATSGLGINRKSLEYSTYEVLVEGHPLLESLVETPITGLSLLPATIDLAGAELELMPKIGRDSYLREAIEPATDHFDLIFIDAPPSLGILTVNALVAAEGLIIPLQAEFYALEGISQLLRTIELVRQRLNPKLEIAKVILTMVDSRTRLSQQVADEVRQFLGDKVSAIEVPRNVRLSEAPSHGLPIALYDPRSRGALAYKKIAEEIYGQTRTRSRPRHATS